MTAVLFCCSSMRAQETVQMTYPQAEWSKAGDILMHTPGQELFYGVIHPAAGLFEDYFDVDVAAEEHQHYMEMLEQNGIRVHTVYNILEEIGIDSLQQGLHTVETRPAFCGLYQGPRLSDYPHRRGRRAALCQQLPDHRPAPYHGRRRTE